MDPELRARFNTAFTPEKYQALLHCVNESERWPADFRVSETPVFLTKAFATELIDAATTIGKQVQTPEFVRHAANAIPAGLEVPNERANPNFLVVDFGVCEIDGRLTPRLIELQAFPSLYAFQLFFLGCLRRSFPSIPRNWTSSFGGLKDNDYLELLQKVIVGNSNPENVILLEIEPEHQKTRIDFACTETLLGVRAVCLTKIRKRGAHLFYDRDGRETRIERIYNRVIFDELIRRSDITPAFRFQDALDVKWVGHPNWYFRISKHSLPFLKTAHTVPAFFANEFPKAESLGDYVLKPLYSFAGLGVEMEPTPEKIHSLDRPDQWILQKKVKYAEFVPTVDGRKSKAEIRMMFVWPDGEQPVLVNNLVRMSQGKMMGVDFNKDKTWVGSNIALHERDDE